MKIMVMTALLCAQVAAVAAPARAAAIEDGSASARQSVSAFAGARLRVELGGRASKTSAGLALAPLGRSVGADGGVRFQFGEGVGLASVDGRAPALSVAGQSMKQLRAAWQSDGADEDDGGVPTWALVAGGVLVAVVVAGALYVDAGNDATD